MAVGFSNTNKPINPRGLDASPKGYNRAALYSGKALDFDGVNDDITIPNSDSINITGNALTIAGYINTDGSTAWQGICYKDSGNQKGFQLFVDKTGDPNIAFGIHTGGFYRLYSNEVIENNKWYFVVATYDGVNQSIYINGVFDNSQTATGNITDSSTENLYIGRNTLGSERFNGEIANFKIFNTALTAAQVADLYNNPEKIVPTGVDNTALKLWLPMMEGAGTTAYDGSGNGNHGTISGATYVNGVGSPVAQSAVIDWNKGTNNQTYSEQANNAQWTQENLTISNNVETAPNGTLTADKMVASAVNTFHFSGQAQSLPNAKNYTASIYAKAAEYEHLYICLRTDTNSNRYGVKFDLTNGTFVDDAGLGTPTQTGYNITSVGDGWYRCEVTSYHTSGDVNGLYGPSPGGNVNGINNTFAGNDVNGIYVWGAQVNEGTTATIYVPTIGTLQPNPVLLPQGLTSGRDITGVNLFENVRKQGALNLDGNSWAEVHDNASLDVTTGLTLEAWLKWDGNLGAIIAKDKASARAYNVLIATGGRISFLINGNTRATQASAVTLNSWTHVLVTYDQVNAKVFINGAEASSSPYTDAIITTADVVEIGRYFGDSVYALSFPIAQPRIYNRALTAAEVLQNYNSGKSIYTNS